jgi:hypothetical protein
MTLMLISFRRFIVEETKKESKQMNMANKERKPMATEAVIKNIILRLKDRTGLDLAVSSWSLGDKLGTRYQLVEIDPKTCRESNIGPTYLGKSNFYDGLKLAEDLLYRVERKELETIKELRK